MLKVDRLEKKFEGRKVIEGMNIELEKEDITTFLGPSGCGKTTFFRILLGLEEPDGGDVSSEGDIAIVFQEPRLINDKTVRENLELIEKLSVKIEKNIEDVIDEVGLSEDSEKTVKDLSGGMKQRVALARALLKDPDILLLDEPFNSLDFISKMELQQIIKKISKNAEKEILYVTHDIESAYRVGDRIVLLSESPSSVKKTLNVSEIEEKQLRQEVKSLY